MAEAELEKNLNRAFKLFFRSSNEVRSVGCGVGFQQKVGAASAALASASPQMPPVGGRRDGRMGVSGSGS